MKQPPRPPAHFDSENDYRGTFCWNGSHCQQESYSGLHSPGRSCSIYLWNDLWVQTFHCSKLFIIANSEGFKVKAKRKRNAKDFAQVSHYTLSVSRFWNEELFVVYTSLKKTIAELKTTTALPQRAHSRRMIYNCFTQKMSIKYFF